MVSDNNCVYCGNPDSIGEIAVKIAELKQSNIYLNLDKTYKGWLFVTLKEHKEELFELSEQQLNGFMAEVSKVASVLKAVVKADKINYAAYGDKVRHFHFHLVPKHENGPEWGSPFVLIPKKRNNMNDLEVEEFKTAFVALF